ncbi:DNA-3-methyladenine glycosylase family protein [Blastomonas sp. RAC04]|uniref:DNA-3-methyladenine glycosylase family protein n=1 Tax=Blastomonas sp. RAC04 TaxID=1842535 RepID=UPI00149555A7|nr:DNA-3-methyladenine glycosylase 2 family protein [Blastomonas sp. RAC04]
MSNPSPAVSRNNNLKAAYRHLRDVYPTLNWLFDATGEIALPDPTPLPVSTSLVKIVVGQMLSVAAARTIWERLITTATEIGVGVHDLPFDELRAAGLSARKAKTIELIAQIVGDDVHYLETWRSLSYTQLHASVRSIWGLGDWSAAMLGIFQFGHPDVFPLSDGSLLRALRLVEMKFYDNGAFQPCAAAPYRSYLALTLWNALDARLLSNDELT